MITDDFDYLAPGGRSYTTTSGLIAKLDKRSRVLEIASGRGEAACALASTFMCKVEAFDIDPVMIEYSREKSKKLGLEDFVDFEVKDGRDLDFGEGKYDMILAEGGALTYIGREDGVARCAELLKEGRFLALTDLIYLRDEVPQTVRDAYEEGVYEYPTEIQYRQMLERHGFEVVHLSMLPQSAWAHPARPGQQVPVADPVAGDGTTQHGGDVVLHEEIGKTLGTVATGECDGHWDRQVEREVPQAPRSDTGHRLALLPARS